MKKIIWILFAFWCSFSWSCLDTPPYVPTLRIFNPPVFPNAETVEEDAAEVEAVLSIDENGTVVQVEIISIKPSALNRELIMQAIEKSKFKVEYGIKDYVHVFEFTIFKS